MRIRTVALAVLAFYVAQFSFAQPSRPSQAAIERRVGSHLSQMSLEEKITYIGGIDDYYVRPIPRLSIPGLKMSDGPLGVHNYGPSFERHWEDNATFKSYYPEKGTKQVEYSEGIFVGYRHFDHSGVKPLFPFGFGLSFTTFAYSNLTISPKVGGLAQPVRVSFDLKNTGHREAAEVAQLYVADDQASVPRPVKELKGFARVQLKPGESRRVELTLDRRAFSFFDMHRKGWNAEPGTFDIVVGSSSQKIEPKWSAPSPSYPSRRNFGKPWK